MLWATVVLTLHESTPRGMEALNSHISFRRISVVPNRWRPFLLLAIRMRRQNDAKLQCALLPLPAQNENDPDWMRNIQSGQTCQTRIHPTPPLPDKPTISRARFSFDGVKTPGKNNKKKKNRNTLYWGATTFSGADAVFSVVMHAMHNRFGMWRI